MKLYLATGPSSEVVIGLFSDETRAMEAANAKAEVSLDWEQPPTFGGWGGSSPKLFPLRNPYWPPFRVRAIELDDGSLGGFAYALDPDDARDLRTLLSERLGGETIPDPYDRAVADRADGPGPAEDAYRCPGCGWESHECMCDYPCRPCFDHDGVPLPTADEIGQDARNFPHDDPCPRCGRRQWGLGPNVADPANPTDAEQATCGGCGFAFELDEIRCPVHGPTSVVSEDSYTGYAGGSCSVATFACGCSEADESADLRAAR